MSRVYAATPGPEFYYGNDSASPTPSPRGMHGFFSSFSHRPEPRPATRAGHHSRHVSSGPEYARPPTTSPRYTSDGRYATANVSSTRSSRKPSWSNPRSQRERRSSYSYQRTPDYHGDSDEDEYIEINGVTYVLPTRSRPRREGPKDFFYNHYPHLDHHQSSPSQDAGRYRTDPYTYVQSGYQSFYDPGYASPRREQPDVRRSSHSRRTSTSVPQRPQTTRPVASHAKKPAAPPRASESDAKKHHIPAGYSLKNWDPTEEPIMLLGSVFDANSLGKWIYDWTVFCHGPDAPITSMAGDLWLLLIELAGKIKHAEEVVPKVRATENKELIEDFIDSGERVMDKLRALLKTCEAPMLKSSKKDKRQLGKNAGVEFVDTLFGRDRELRSTETFMQHVRTWNHRFAVNCDTILENPSL